MRQGDSVVFLFRIEYYRGLVKIWTHKIDGLADADFIPAAKIDCLPRDAEP
jgi:pterin-4a-carbinolamine dehydratase